MHAQRKYSNGPNALNEYCVMFYLASENGMRCTPRSRMTADCAKRWDYPSGTCEQRKAACIERILILMHRKKNIVRSAMAPSLSIFIIRKNQVSKIDK